VLVSRAAPWYLLGGVLSAGPGWRWVLFVNLYGLVRAPDVGWGAASTVAELAAAGVLLGAFGVNEARQRHPLVPPSIFRLKGRPAANTSQVIAMAGFYSVFFFITLYMQNVLGFSPLRAGSA
jgi:hypothetical protein